MPPPQDAVDLVVDLTGSDPDVDDVARLWSQRSPEVFDRLVPAAATRLRDGWSAGSDLDAVALGIMEEDGAVELAALAGYWTARRRSEAGADRSELMGLLRRIVGPLDGRGSPHLAAIGRLCRALAASIDVERARSANSAPNVAGRSRRVVDELRALHLPEASSGRRPWRCLDRIIELEWRTGIEYHLAMVWVGERTEEFDRCLRPGCGPRAFHDLTVRIRRDLPLHRATARSLQRDGDPRGAELSAQLRTLEAVSALGDRGRLLAGGVEIRYLYPFRCRPVVALRAGAVIDGFEVDTGDTDHDVDGDIHGVLQRAGIGCRPLAVLRPTPEHQVDGVSLSVHLTSGPIQYLRVTVDGDGWWTPRDLDTWLRRTGLTLPPPASDLDRTAAEVIDRLCVALADAPGTRFAPTVVVGVAAAAAIGADGVVVDLDHGDDPADLVGAEVLHPGPHPRPVGLDDWLVRATPPAPNLVAAGDTLTSAPGAVVVSTLTSPERVHDHRLALAELAVVCHTVIASLLDRDQPVDGDLRGNLATAAAVLRPGPVAPADHALVIAMVSALDGGDPGGRLADRIGEVDTVLSEQDRAERAAVAASTRILLQMLVALVGFLALRVVLGDVAWAAALTTATAAVAVPVSRRRRS